MFHALFGLHRQRHDIFLLFLSCSALDCEGANISQIKGSVSDYRLVHHKDWTKHTALLHILITDKVERIIRVVTLLLPYANVEIVDEIPLWRVVHLYESLRSEENRVLCLVGHEKFSHNPIEFSCFQFLLLYALLRHNVGSFEGY